MNEIRLTGSSLAKELKLPLASGNLQIFYSDNNGNIFEIDDLVIGETPQEVVPLKYNPHDKFYPKSKDLQLFLETFF